MESLRDFFMTSASKRGEKGAIVFFREGKAETQISLNREEDSKIVNVSCKRSRNYGFEDFDFFINRFGYPEVIDASTPDIDF